MNKKEIAFFRSRMMRCYLLGGITSLYIFIGILFILFTHF